MNKLKELFLYGIFGAMATVLNIIAYWFFTRFFNLSTVNATFWAWFTAVMFAYFTNHTFVFQSSVRSFTGIAREMFYFFSCRVITGVIDIIIMYVFVDIFKLNDVYVKTVSNIIVIILNYIASKLFIFRKK